MQLTKTYGSGDTVVHALDDVSLGIEAGTFTAIMGPSGSGKSTLMHCLAALDVPTAGAVFLGETNISQLSDRDLTILRRTRMGFIFQAYNLVDVLTAEQNIELPFQLAGKTIDKKALRELADELDLTSRLTHLPSELSGGQQQRVAIARALLSSPDVIFADEPTGALDSSTSTAVLQLLRRCVVERGQTVVMVTHDAEAAAYADRIVRLRDGRIEADERQLVHADRHVAPQSVQAHPVTAPRQAPQADPAGQHHLPQPVSGPTLTDAAAGNVARPDLARPAAARSATTQPEYAQSQYAQSQRMESATPAAPQRPSPPPPPQYSYTSTAPTTADSGADTTSDFDPMYVELSEEELQQYIARPISQPRHEQR